MLSDAQRSFYNRQGPPIRLLYSARRAYSRACISQNINETLLLQDVKENIKARDHGSVMEVDMMLTRVQSSLYDYIVDDMLTIGAFELYAKAILAGLGVLVHCVKSPKMLEKEQKKRPIQIEAAEQAGATVLMRSIKPSQILKHAYCDLIGIPEEHRGAFVKINDRRNLIHGHPITGYSFERDILAAIKWLGEEIEDTVEKTEVRLGIKENGHQ